MATLERVGNRSALIAPTNEPEARTTAADYDREFVDSTRPTPNVELVRGKLVLQPVPHVLHSLTVAALMQAFLANSLGDLKVLPDVTSAFGEDRFQPDIALARFSKSGLIRMLDRTEIHLAIEVAVSSLAYDRDEKTIYYAEGGIPEYWIVNPVARQIEVYRRPVDGRYQDVYLVLPGEVLDTLCLPGVEFAVDALLPNIE